MFYFSSIENRLSYQYKNQQYFRYPLKLRAKQKLKVAITTLIFAESEKVKFTLSNMKRRDLIFTNHNRNSQKKNQVKTQNVKQKRKYQV